jgi:Ca2+-binding EF-hand superfamily protein
MLTDFRKRKLMALFDLYDIDKDGLLEQADYERIAQNLAAFLHYQPGSPEYARLYADRMASWHNLYQLCGAPSSQRVTQEEFLAALDRLLSDKNNYQAFVGSRTDSITEMSDQDGDGRLTRQEYVAGARSYGTDEATANEAFRRLDQNGDGYLTRDEILRSVEEFFYSDNPEGPGNWLFGPV